MINHFTLKTVPSEDGQPLFKSPHVAAVVVKIQPHTIYRYRQDNRILPPPPQCVCGGGTFTKYVL